MTYNVFSGTLNPTDFTSSKENANTQLFNAIFFWDYPGDRVPEEIFFWTFMVQGNITGVDTPII